MGHAQQSSVPAIYGRYQTLFRIAAGGMAEVYAARVRGAAGFQKLVALKRMLPHLTDDERFVNMFMDEGKLASNIDSPNVVSTMDLGRADDGSLYLVMELVVGTTLSTLLRNGAKAGQQVPPSVACEILAQAAMGLHDAHEAKTAYGAPLQLVHRDISPQNILVGIDGRVRITDFGVARAVLRRTKTSTGEFKGKLSYFSPEQCADRDLDRRSDLFSLGVVAWETLTTRRLFHAENPLAVLERVTRMPIPSAHAVRPEIPAAVAAVVAMALERDRDLRYPTAAEFAKALRAAARDEFGAPDTAKITTLVERFGGEQLERMQSRLKESLANPRSFVDIGDELDDPTEISSGIVMRPDEIGRSTPRATPPASALPSFAQPSDHKREAPRASRAPLIVAIIIAILGMGAGATIAVVAGSGDATPAPPAEAVLPAEEPRAASAPAEQEVPPPDLDLAAAAPEADLELEPEPDEPPAAEATATPTRPTRPARRRPRVRPTPQVRQFAETHPEVRDTRPAPRPQPTTTRPRTVPRPRATQPPPRTGVIIQDWN